MMDGLLLALGPVSGIWNLDLFGWNECNILILDYDSLLWEIEVKETYRNATRRNLGKGTTR